MIAVLTHPWPGEHRVEWILDPDAVQDAVRALACMACARRKEAMWRAMEWLDAAERLSSARNPPSPDPTVRLVRVALWAVDDAVSELERRGHLE